ncbi:protein kinase domain-containing protein [Candidatus Chloroploca asiatica]|uniref:non-specific serine/threonine protein kinase n=1 Tax=Candidatus Chloroploca asiatica TaxID=1506545 RepID=A0A2H3KS89_9CHLR|nr:FHA domain-containing protein [Candidatus Chloroploca asiatica]PDV98105.1 hypothetical protein A9Q02_03220 [Candidatus Chloroploca asiatica]
MGAVVVILLVLLLIIAGAAVGVAIWMSQKASHAGAASGERAHLQVVFANGPVRAIALPRRGVVTIGRDAGCTLPVEHHLVSRRHARIMVESNAWLLEDTESANGTFLNGRSVMGARLKPGDMIEIGPARITLVVPAGFNPSQVVTQSRPMGKPGPSTGGAGGNTSHQLFGNYAVVRSLGEGGFGKIMLAQDQRDRRLVALKLLNTADDYLTQKFRQEGAIKLDHQHIARIYDAGEVNGRSYIAMEYVEGISLYKLLNGRPLPIETALIIAGQILLALEYAHRNKIIHRDIKPENIMLSVHHGVKIIDFGIAKVLSSVTRTRDGMVIGTPQYMSYEQAMGQPVTPASDIYATAIVIYEMLTANVPFSADQSIDIVRMHQSALPMPPGQLNANIPASIDEAIMRALEKEQNLRFQSAIEFATSLGCPLGKPLPPEIITEIARQTPPVINERSNASHLPTRAPSALPQMTGQGQAALRVQSGPRRGQVIAITGQTIIGRLEIDPSDGTISRQHFRLERQNGRYLIWDSSSHGTVVDGTRLRNGTSHPLKHGTQIQVGQTILIYEDQT